MKEKKRELPFLIVVFSESSRADLQCSKSKTRLPRISCLSACWKTSCLPLTHTIKIWLWKFWWRLALEAELSWHWDFGAHLLSWKTNQNLSPIGCVGDLQPSESGIAQLHLCAGFSVSSSVLPVKKPSSHAGKMTGWICPKADTKAFVHGLAVNKMLR